MTRFFSFIRPCQNNNLLSLNKLALHGRGRLSHWLCQGGYVFFFFKREKASVRERMQRKKSALNRTVARDDDAARPDKPADGAGSTGNVQ